MCFGGIEAVCLGRGQLLTHTREHLTACGRGLTKPSSHWQEVERDKWLGGWRWECLIDKIDESEGCSCNACIARMLTCIIEVPFDSLSREAQNA